jgi:signal transduction histidine kinase
MMVALIVIGVGVMLQIVSLIIARQELETAHQRTAQILADVLVPQVEQELSKGSASQLPLLLKQVKGTTSDISYIIVCNPEGATIAHDQPEALSESLTTLVASKSQLAPYSLSYNLDSEKGVVLHLVQPLKKGLMGYLHLGLSRAPVHASLRSTCLKLSGAMLVALVLSGLLALWAYRKMAGHIRELTQAAEDFGAGRFSTRVKEKIGTWDEASFLARSFNQMAERMEEHVNALLQSRTELSDEKARIQSVLDGMVQAVVVAENDGRVVYCNQAARALWWPCACKTDDCHYQELRQNCPDALRTFKSIACGEALTQRHVLRHKGRELGLVISPVRGAGGEFLGVIEITTDETEQRQSWRELAHAEKLNVVGQLAAGVAHEINSPLDGAIEASRIIEHHADEAEKVTRFAQAQRQGLERIATIVRRLLTYSRLPSHRQRETVAIPRVLDEAVGILKYRLVQARINLKKPDFNDKDLYTRGDELGLIQVLVNLCNNAIDVTPEGGIVQIDVRIRHNFLEISVTDQGPGVTEEAAEKMFTPFYTTKSVGKGTGLGLAISRNIVEEHGGKLEFSNEAKPWGARFVVVLPLCDHVPPTQPARMHAGKESVG